MVIATPLAERFPTTPQATVGTNSRSTVSTCSHSTIATGRPYVAVACSVFDLAGWSHKPQNRIRARLGPKALFGFVLPSTVVGLRSVIHRTRQCRLVVIFRLAVFRQNRGHYTQCLDFVFYPRLFKLFLSQNFVNVLHAQAPNNSSE